MYLPSKPQPQEVDFYMGEVRGMMIEIVDNNDNNETESHSQEDREMKAPKKRAETWIQDEIRSLINFRREIDGLFNTSKSNKHLWEQISSKMREKGFDRSPNMCTDKWRNLLKEFKKVRQQERGSGSGKLSYYKELEELLRERNRNAANCNTPLPKPQSYLHFADKALDETNNPFAPVEASGRSAINHERHVNHDGHPLAITAADAVAANGLPPWNWRANSLNGGENRLYGGRVITVKWGEFTRRIGIDGSTDAIKEAIKSAFGFRTGRAFWLEDEDEVIRSLDRDMPLGAYTLHLDDGATIKMCTFDDSERMPIQTEEKTFYTEDDFRDFLAHRGLSSLREMNDFRNVDTLNDLRPGAMYHGTRLVRE